MRPAARRERIREINKVETSESERNNENYLLYGSDRGCRRRCVFAGDAPLTIPSIPTFALRSVTKDADVGIFTVVPELKAVHYQRRNGAFAQQAPNIFAWDKVRKKKTRESVKACSPQETKTRLTGCTQPLCVSVSSSLLVKLVLLTSLLQLLGSRLAQRHMAAHDRHYSDDLQAGSCLAAVCRLHI